MEYSYYRDSRHHYLTIPCPEVENYQYRMLAANRMESLIPCSIRNVDGRRYLYYDITARESMTEFFHGHGGAAQEIPRLLYAIADAGTVLERYLLDCGRMLLGPEFVFYDYTRGEFSFLYYPEDPEEPTGPAFYEYLADHADPQDKMLYYTLLRLISISANRTFVLEEGFLTRALGRQRPQEDSLTGLQADTRPGGMDGSYTNGNVWQDDVAGAAAGIPQSAPAYGRSTYGDSAYGQMRESAIPPDSMSVRGGTPLTEDRDGEDAEDMESSPVSHGQGGHLVLFVVASVIFLGGAIGLACARIYVPMNGTYEMAARIGMAVCLAASILVAIYGAYRGLRSSRQELHSMRDHARWERRNALAPVDDFR